MASDHAGRSQHEVCRRVHVDVGTSVLPDVVAQKRRAATGNGVGNGEWLSSVEMSNLAVLRGVEGEVVEGEGELL